MVSPSSSDQHGPENDGTRSSGRHLSRRRAVGGGALGLLSAAILTACGQGNGSTTQADSTSSASTSASESAFAPKVDVVPAAGAKDVVPTKPITVTTAEGEIKSVEVSGGKNPVEGTISQDKKTWTSTGTYDFHTDYTVKYTVVDGDRSHDGTSAFSTLPAEKEADATLNVKNGETYGTGMPIQFTFSEPVTNKKAVEQAIKVTGGGDQPGRFRWYSDTLVRYRPKDKWAPNSSVTMTADLLGTDIGNGMVFNQNLKVSFKIGAKHYAYVDNNTKTMKIYENDKLTQTYPVTLGDAEWPSVTGQLAIVEQAPSYYFDASTLGLKRGDSHWYEPFYATNVSRLTDSGAFVHQAEPPAYPYIGNTNISHGCIGLMPAACKYFYDTFRVGDIVETVNTNYGEADPDNGYGDWNIPWEHYTDTSWKGNW